MISYKKKYKTIKTCPVHLEDSKIVRLESCRARQNDIDKWVKNKQISFKEDVYYIVFNCHCNFYVSKKTGEILEGILQDDINNQLRFYRLNPNHADLNKFPNHYCDIFCADIPVFEE